MRYPRLHPIPFFSLPLLLALPLPAAAQAPPSSPPFVETIEVREVEVRVDVSALPTFESIGRKGREDFIVIEDGIAHPLTELGEAEASPWIFVLYFDSILAGPEARQRAASELAGQSERLVAGGLAEIVVADPSPRLLLATASAEALRRQLEELAVSAGREAARAETALAAATVARLAQVDRLTVEIAARGGGGARGLLLPVGSWPIDAAGLARLTRTESTGRDGLPEFEPLQEAARVLSGYGWVTLAVAIQPPSTGVEISSAERRLQVSTGGSGDQRQSVPIVTIPAQQEKGDPATEAQVDTLTDFGLMPFAVLARATSGAVVGDAARLSTHLAQLARRRQFTYRSPFPQPGRLLPLEVRWKGGDGRLLSAPRWLRSSTPPEVAAARLRRLLAGDEAPQAQPTSAIRWTADGKRSCFPGASDKRWVRLSTATQKDGTIQVETGSPVQIERSADGLCTEVPSVTTGVAGAAGLRIARLAEDLENETWTGAATGN